MHRSGTSLVANVLHHAGINMGDDLLPADVGNRHGYYEDALIHDVHVEMMRSAGVADAFTVTPDDLPLTVEDALRERARGVIASRSAQDRWGWKEPRSALFCDFWNDLVGDLRFVFCLRDPTLVLDSLIRRASQSSINDQ
ncbi:MAG: chromosome partitioning protein ParA, partial [Actinomycetota bacterium]